MAKIRWTKQYFGCRMAGNWKLTEKIANPLEAMKQAWGDSIMQDVVFIIGLQPTPIERGGERFDATYEIVDLGRNKREAGKTLETLQEAAKAEQRLHKILAEDADGVLQSYLTTRDEHLKTQRKRMGDSITNGGFANARYNMDDLVRAELAASTAREIIDNVERDTKAAVDGLAPSVAELRISLFRKHTATAQKEVADALITANIAHDWNAWTNLYNMEMHKARARIHQELKTLLDGCAERDKALEEMDRRTRLRRKPIDQQLGPSRSSSR